MSILILPGLEWSGSLLISVLIALGFFAGGMFLSGESMRKIMARFDSIDTKLEKLDEISDTLREMRDTLNAINRKLK